MFGNMLPHIRELRHDQQFIDKVEAGLVATAIAITAAVMIAMFVMVGTSLL